MADADRPQTLAPDLSGLSGILLSEQPLHELLRIVVLLARALVDDADGASVTLARDGRVLTSNWTDDVVHVLDGVQYEFDEGPCVDAMQHDRQVLVDLEAERDRYPHFAPAAIQRFMRSVLSTPLRVRDQPTGALNIYSTSDLRAGQGQERVASLFAEQASVLLANAYSYSTSERKNSQLEEALNSRDTIGQAKGILMERTRCSANDAFDVLRQASQRRNVKLAAVADELVATRQLVER